MLRVKVPVKVEPTLIDDEGSDITRVGDVTVKKALVPAVATLLVAERLKLMSATFTLRPGNTATPLTALTVVTPDS